MAPAHARLAPASRAPRGPPGTLSGVIGVAVTGRILDAAGGAAVKSGWFVAHAVCASICGAACFAFSLFARGERLFD